MQTFCLQQMLCCSNVGQVSTLPLAAKRNTFFLLSPVPVRDYQITDWTGRWPWYFWSPKHFSQLALQNKLCETVQTWYITEHINGLAQDCSNFSAWGHQYIPDRNCINFVDVMLVVNLLSFYYLLWVLFSDKASLVLMMTWHQIKNKTFPT